MAIFAFIFGGLSGLVAAFLAMMLFDVGLMGGIGVFYLTWLAESWTPGRTLNAQFLDLEGSLEPGSGPPTRIIVKTEEGREGLLAGARHVPFRKGRGIVVREETSDIFGRVRYRFVRLADQPD